MLVGRPSGIVYTCPASSIVIVKSAHLFVGGSTPGLVELYAVRQNPQAYAQLLSLDFPATSPVVWAGWLVLEPSDELQLNAVMTGVHYWISGAVLPQPSA